MSLLWAVLFLVSATTVVSADCVGKNGDIYPDNSGPYPAGDGCNLCNCTAGTLDCTNKDCGCHDLHLGIWVSEGSSVVTTDGCVRCQCSGGNMNCEGMNCGCRKPDGHWVESGTSYQPDCNTCTCGNLYGGCTLMGCSGCYTHDGFFNFNETWPSADGCNTCTCEVPEGEFVLQGNVVCTQNTCPAK